METLNSSLSSGQATKFHFFTLLPFELRLKIWSYSDKNHHKQIVLAKPHRFHRSHQMAWNLYFLIPRTGTNHYSHPFTPPVLHTCRESRAEFLRGEHKKKHVTYNSVPVLGPGKSEWRICMNFELERHNLLIGNWETFGSSGAYLEGQMLDFCHKALTNPEESYRMLGRLLCNRVYPPFKLSKRCCPGRPYGNRERAALRTEQRRAKTRSPEENEAKHWLGIPKMDYEKWRVLEVKFVPWRELLLHFPKRGKRKEGKIIGREKVLRMSSEEQREARDVRAMARGSRIAAAS